MCCTCFRQAGFSSYAVEDATCIHGTLPAPDHGVSGVLDAVEVAYRSAGMLAPEWVRLMRHELRAT